MRVKKVIKAVLFDIGDVILDDGYVKGIRLFEIDKNITNGKLYYVAHDLAPWKDFTRGKLSEKKYWQEVKTKAKNHLKIMIDIQKLRQYVINNMVYHPEVVDYISKIKKKYKTGIVSNFAKEWFHFFAKKYDFSRYFDVVSISGMTGIRKPEKAAFDYALRKLKIKPQEAVFIDDKQKYTDIAQQYGMIGIKFENVKKLKKDLGEILEN